MLLWLEWELTEIDCEEEEQEKLCDILEQLEQLEHEEISERELEEKLNDEDERLGLELLELLLWLLMLRLRELEDELWLSFEDDTELHEELFESWLSEDECLLLLLQQDWIEHPLLEEQEECSGTDELQDEEKTELKTFDELQLEE